MVYDASHVPFLDAAIQEVFSKAVPDEFFVQEPIRLGHSFVHQGVECELSVIAGSTPLRHMDVQTVGCNYMLKLKLLGPDGHITAPYTFCIIEPTEDCTVNRKCAIRCLHVLKTVGGIRFVQLKATE